MKACSKCGGENDTKQSYCRPCRNAYQREWRIRNPEAAREQKRRYRDSHPEEVAESKRRQYHASLESARRRQRQRRAEKPDVFAEYARRRREKAQEGGLYALYRHGITSDQRVQLETAQDGQCPLCNKPLSEVRVNIDHDHATGRIRGLLCHTCNNRLGWYENRREVIAAYLAGPHLEPAEPRRTRSREN